MTWHRHDLGRSWSAAATACLLVGLAGCTGGGAAQPSGTGTTPTGGSPAGSTHVGLTATVVQQRADIGTRRIGLELTTDARTTVHVDQVQLDTPAFESRPPTAKDTDFPPGRTIDLTVDYGDPVCRPDVSPRGATVVVGYTAASGSGELRLRVDRIGIEELTQLHDDGCAHAALVDAASLTYRTPFRREVVDGQQTLVGALVLTRPPDGGSGSRVVIDSILGSVLFELEPIERRRDVLRLDPDHAVASVPVLIRGNDRCEPHALSSSQQTFVFTAIVRIGPGRPYTEIIEPPRSLQVQAMALLHDVCH